MRYTDSIKNVLLVDDDTNITFLTKIALNELTDWKIEVVESGAKALKLVETFTPDLILLDAMMPEMDGRATYTKLREMNWLNSTYVIFITAKVQADEVDQFRALGAEGVITKPFDPICLVDTIEEVITQSKLNAVK
ncbi:MAG: response regulator [Cyanobacteria bacterium SZAS LIN-3]|nr:response regulator [Cyanobacteria bacterium SZAS LIN-3]